jgi:hypothetical protein
VQQGLAIGLASNVVQSQMTVLMDALLDYTSCKAPEAGTGSSKVLQRSTTGNVTTVSVDVYYDASCAQPYIEAAAQLSSTAATNTISTAPPFGCSGAVAQPFPALGLSLASVAPLTITLTPIAGADGWAVTGASNGTSFALTLESSSEITGSVTTAAGASLAQLTLDQSGSGTITYAGGSTAPVTSWTLGG